jgi:sec-independent protein translocase protein TatC
MITLTRLKSRARPEPQPMTLGEHLRELRRRVLIVIAALFVMSIVAFVLYPQILHVLESPYCRITPRCQLYVTGPLDGLSLRVKIATYGGFFLSAPVILWELWRFITPGLLSKEKRYAVPFLAASILLFSGGVALAYLTFPHALRFLGAIGGPSLHQLYGPSQYLGLVIALMAVFGVTFEFPVILVGLELAGVLSRRPGQAASLGDRRDRRGGGCHHAERRPFLHARSRGSSLRLLRALNSGRQVGPCAEGGAEQFVT